MAPQLHPFPNRSPSRQRENPLYLRKLWNMDTHEGAGISLFVTGFRSARRRSRGRFLEFLETLKRPGRSSMSRTSPSSNGPRPLLIARI